MLSGDTPDDPVLYAAAHASVLLGRLESEQAAHPSASKATSHWMDARTWFRSTLERLNRIHEPGNSSDDDVGPVDIAQIRKELADCEEEVRRSGR